MFLKVKRTWQDGIPEPEMPDEVLVSRYLDTGNKDLIAVLFDRYTHLVYGICLNYLHDPDVSKDAVMDIFASLFDKLAVHEVASFKNWLYSVSRNHCLMALRKGATYRRSKENLASRILSEDAEMPVPFPDQGGEPDEFRVRKAIESLNAEQRLCVSLMYLEDKSYKDIAGLTGYTFNQVKSHIQNGKRNLRKYLLNQHDDIDP